MFASKKPATVKPKGKSDGEPSRTLSTNNTAASSVLSEKFEDQKKLVDTCQEGNLATSRSLCQANAASILAAINSPIDVNGNRALHLSVSHNDYTLTALLLQKGADPLLTNRSGVNPAMIAKRMGHSNLLNLLIQHGSILPFKEEKLSMSTKAVEERKNADHNRSDEPEFTSNVVLPLPSGSPSTGLFSSLSADKKRDDSNNNDESLRKSMFQQAIESKTFPIYDASYLGFYEAISTNVSSENIHAMDSNGETALMKASHRGHLDLVRLLIKQGAKVDQVDDAGNSALLWAALAGKLNVVKLLLENNASIETNGLTMTPLIAAVHGGHNEMVEYLISKDVDINARIGSGRGKSALMVACWGRKVGLVRLLLQNHATVDPDVEKWLVPGAMFLKRLSMDCNPWMNTLSEQSSKRDLPPKKINLQDKLLYLTPEENDALAEVTDLITNGVKVKQELSVRASILPVTDNAGSIAKQGSVVMSRTNVQRRRNNTFRQGLNLEKLLGNNSEMIMGLAEIMPEKGTQLDELWIAMFQCVVQLVMAANKNIKHQYIAISAKAVHSASEIVRAVEGIDKSKQGQKQDISWSQDSPIRAQVKELSSIISTEFPKQLMLSTRMAIGVWPPPDAVSEMIKEATSLASACRDLVLLANTFGHYPVLDKTLEIQFQAFEDDAPAMPAPVEEVPIENGVDGDRKRLKGGLNYTEYKRQNDLKLIEEMSKRYDAPSKQASQEGLNVTDERATDNDFFKTLDSLLKSFVASVTELKAVHDRHFKEEFINATSTVHARADTLMEEINNFELLSDYPDDLMFQGEDGTRLEGLGVKLPGVTFPCLAKPLYQTAFEEVNNTAQEVMAKGKTAASNWPPPGSETEMLQSVFPCILSVKKLVVIAKESARIIRETHSEERRKKDMWKKECMQNERVKQLFQMWESQVLSDQSAGPRKQNTQFTSEDLQVLEDTTEGLVIDQTSGKRVVKGGRLAKLVECITSHSSNDDELMAALIMTHHSFTTSAELLEQFFKRYDISPPYGLTQRLFDLYIDKKIVAVRLRVCAALQHWVTHHFEEDFMDYEVLVLRYKEFVEKKVAFDFENTSVTMLETLNKKLNEDGRARIVPQLSPERDRNCPKPLLPVPRFGADPLTLLPTDSKAIFDIEPLEVARQLTLIEFSLFARVKSYECLDQIWDSQRRKEAITMRTTSSSPKRHIPGSASSDISKLINHTNLLTFWIATMILRNDALKTRMNVLKFFISLALHCREYNNLTGVTTIIGALSMAPISRLHKTWHALEDKYPKVWESYKELADTVSPKFQYANYRKVLKEMSPPAIPFLGVYLTDLTFLELGNPDFLPDSHWVNFEKRRKVYGLVQEIQRYQQVPFAIIPVPQLQDFLNRVTQSLPRSKRDDDFSVMNDDELYEQSLIVEPKEVEDDDD